MKLGDNLYRWWKAQHVKVRKPFTFTLGIVLIVASPVVGTIPGPGGIAVFLAGIAVLATEFDWAESLKEFFLTTVPAEVKNRWRPTPRWQAAFDVTSAVLIATAAGALYIKWWAPVLSLGSAGTCLFLFNRDRLSRLKVKLKRKH